MKKSVVILIALIYVISIALVGFLGLKAKSYNDVVYVEALEVLNEYQSDKNGHKFIVLNGENTLQFDCRVIPENANDTGIIYQLQSDETKASIDENGLLVFNPTDKPAVSVQVYIYASQNRELSEEITVYYKP